MWLYYCALQIVILIVRHINMFAPSSVEVFIDSISGIFNLSSLDKELVASKLGLNAITSSQVFQRLDMVALSGIGILLVVFMFSIAMIISRVSPAAHDLFLRIKNFIFWNFLIRYFQVSFIGLNFASLSLLQSTVGGV